MTSKSGRRPLVASLRDLTAPATAIEDIAAKLEVEADRGPEGSSKEINVVESYETHLRQNPRKFVEQLLAAWNGEGWRGYNDYIGAKILEPGQSDKTAREVLHSKNVQDRIRKLAYSRVETLYPQHVIDGQEAEKRQRLQKAKNKLRKELEQQLYTIAETQIANSIGRLDSLSFIKVFAASLNNILVRLYNQGIHINLPQVLELRRVAQIAQEKKQSIIFLPCHKSHIDYLTVSWILFRIGLSLPTIVAGENLDLPVLGNVLRKGGAMYIRRTFSGDQLYPVVIREYVEHLLSAGRSFEVFIEGTRSRTGKLLPPKLGILKYILEGLQTRRTEDVFICPVSLQYDSVIESETYVSELLGKPKEQESLLGFLSGSGSLLSLRLGRIDVRFQRPWSLKSFIDEQHEMRRNQVDALGGDSSRSPIDFAGNAEHKLLLLKASGYRVLADINKCSVVMPAALVGTILLTLRGRGIGRSALERRVDWLKGAIVSKGFQVADFGQMSTSEVVERALALMKPLIEIQTDVMEETILPAKRFELSFYRNQVIHVFVNEALLSAALYTKVKQGGTAPMQLMSRVAVIRECAFISGVLRNEFVYGTEGVDANVHRTIDQMIKDQVLEEEKPASPDSQPKIGVSSLERERGRESFDSFLFLIWPFIESYWLAACSLLLLAPPKEQHEGGKGGPGKILWFAAKDFEKKAQLFGKTLYQQGEIAYLEAINAATLGQAFARMDELGLVLRKKSVFLAGANLRTNPFQLTDALKPIPLIAISPEFCPIYPSDPSSAPEPQPGNRLWEFLDHLSSFRREGKERREILLGERVMRHVLSDEYHVVEVSRVDGQREVAEGSARL